MQYFDLINKCLVELNIREVSTWDALTLNDHKHLKDVVARLNSQLCSRDEWPFLQRIYTATIPVNTKKLTNPVSGSIDIITVNGNKYSYSSDYVRFLTDNPIAGHFALYGKDLYLPPFDEPVSCEIFYNSDFSAVDAAGVEKKYLELATDESLIPEVFQEPLLVYGACMRLKSNPELSKFKYWYSMYNDALATLRAKSSLTTNDNSQITLERG